MKIEVLTNKSRGFYPKMGPLLSRRDIAAELGSPVWDDDEKVWFVASDRKGVAGFAAVTLHGDAAHFCSDYIKPESRGKRVHDRLMAERLRYVNSRAKVVKAVVHKPAQGCYKRHGFKPRGMRTGRYARMEKRIGG